MPTLPSFRGKPLAIVAALLAIGLVAIAVNQNSTAKKWRKNEQVEASRSQDLTNRLTSANASLTSMSSQVVSLQGHVASLKKSLQSTANQKEKALDQNVVLHRITAVAAAISEELSGCVDDMQNLIAEIGQDLETNTYDPYLGQNAANAEAACSSAQSANAELQSEIGSLG